MKTLLFFLCFISLQAAAQIKGRVVDLETNNALAGASIFINNTSVGTTANQNGEFILQGLPQPPFELVISYVGYETLVTKISDTTSKNYLFKLQAKDKELENIIVKSYDKNGWQRWGKLFLNNFIGTSALASQCKLENEKDIRFRYDESTQVLTAHAAKTITIINKTLGYKIEYQLEDFSYDFRSRYLLFTGYPFFTEMKGTAAQKRKWEKKRKEVYEGSLLHFMRSLYSGKFTEAGYVVQRLDRIPNKEKERVKTVLRYAVDNTLFPRDTMSYYNKVMGQPDYKDVLYTTPLKFEEFASRIDSSTVSIDVHDFLLQVSYPAKKEAPEYALNNMYVKPGSFINSLLYLINEIPVSVSRSGDYYNSYDLTLMGYWGWWEKLSTMLPLDYDPEKP